jgi:hypothetical protein
MTTYLNIDELAPPKKELTLKGVTYEMHTVTVGEFIEFMRANGMEDQKKFDELPFDERLEKLIDQIHKAFPTVPDDDLRGLTMDQLVTIIQFISGNLKEEAEAKAGAKDKVKN